MGHDSEQDILHEWNVAEPNIDWLSMRARMRARGASTKIINELEQDQELSESLIAMCLRLRDPLIYSLRQERFGKTFAMAMRKSPTPTGGPEVALYILPIFDTAAITGHSQKRLIIEKLAQIMAAFEWDLSDPPGPTQGGGSRSSKIKRLADVKAVMSALLDFFPGPAHTEILVEKERLLLKAITSGTTIAFSPQPVAQEHSAAKAL